MSRLKILPVALLLFIAFSCDQEEEQSPYVINNSVFPGDFLSDKKYTSLVLEVVFVNGYEPTQSALNNLVTFLGARLNKPVGITTVLRGIPSPGKATFDASYLRDLEKIHRQRVNSDKVLTAWLFFVDGEYSTNTSSSKVLGVAYGASSIAVFENTVNQMSGGLNQPRTAALETTILEHEFGHILGLVNNGTSMVAPHQDTDHSAHCTNIDCLMYYKAETRIIGSDVTGKGVPVLDENCLADLKAAGGK
ncbi:MAG TPA: peptidase [Cyclobacteriaceae bacterium]|nr:peptidase [Cyclobacteriaceae bacterium]